MYLSVSLHVRNLDEVQAKDLFEQFQRFAAQTEDIARREWTVSLKRDMSRWWRFGRRNP